MFGKFALTLAAMTLGTWLIDASHAQALEGVFKTQEGENGGYLHVEMAPCADLMCGTIIKVVGPDGTEANPHEFLGRNIISGMKPNGDAKWKSGKIWAPDQDKTYRASMKLLSDSELEVKGCVAIICRSQVWTRQ